MRLFGIILENVELNVVILLMDIYFIVLDYYNFEKIVYDRVIDGKSLYFVFKDLNFFFFNLFYDQFYYFCDFGFVGVVIIGNLKVLFRKGIEIDCFGLFFDNFFIFNVLFDFEELYFLFINVYMFLLYYIKVFLKKYEMKVNFYQIKYLQFDQMFNFFDFLCDDIFDCLKIYDEDGSFDVLFDE